MEKDLSFILLVIAGIVLLSLIIYSLKARFSGRYQHMSDPEAVDLLEPENLDLLSDAPAHIDFKGAVAPIMETPLSAEKESIAPKQMDETPHENKVAEKPLETPVIISLCILAKENEQFIGYELLQSLLSAGFRYGAMSIFHRHEKLSGEGKKLFSLAQATEPGIFDMHSIGAHKCPGLVLFMQLSGPEHNPDSFELLLETAAHLAEDLNGILTDARRQPLNEGILANYRQQVETHAQRYRND